MPHSLAFFWPLNNLFGFFKHCLAFLLKISSGNRAYVRQISDFVRLKKYSFTSFQALSV